MNFSERTLHDESSNIFLILEGNMTLIPFGKLSFHLMAEGNPEKCSVQRRISRADDLGPLFTEFRFCLSA